MATIILLCIAFFLPRGCLHCPQPWLLCPRTIPQVSKKCVHIYQLIRSQPDEAWRTLAMQQFVSKVRTEVWKT